MNKNLKKISTLDMPHEEWLRHRQRSIGGSDAAAIVGLSAYVSPYTVWADKLGKIPPSEDNEAMRQGRDLEQYVAERFAEATGKKVRRENNILINPDFPFAHANVDRIVIGEDAGLECKTTNQLNLKKFKKLIAGDNITIAADGKTISATGGGGGGSTVELDTTLSKVGKAADAKAVGDALAGKQDTISDLESIRAGAAKGATALQAVPSTYRTASEQDTIDSGKVDKVTGKGLSSNDYTDAAKAKVDALAPVATSGSYNDLTNKPTIPTAYDDTEVRQRIGAIEAKESTWDAKSNFSGSYNDLTNKPTIPDAVTETTVSGWGFTKNTGTYSKPTGGIPKTDLASTVQTSLDKADTALQTHQSLAAYRTALAQDVIDSDLSDRISAIEGKEAGWNGKYAKPTGGIPKTDLASSVQTSLGKADTALQSVPSTYRTASAQDTIDNKKVDKVTGKGLSTNDYTAAAKAKVDAIPANPKYTDTVYNDTAVKNRLTAIEKHEDVSLTADTSRITNVSYTAKYFQLLGIVFVRIYGKINASLNAGYDYDLFTIDNRVPDSNAALSVKCAKNAMAVAKTSSNGNAIQIRPLESGINGYDVYITGFWFV